MSKFLVSWSSVLPPNCQPMPFEYLVHPSVSDAGARYCSALIEAEERQSAWQLVAHCFPGAIRHLVEPTTKATEESFNETRKLAGIRVIAPKQA